MQGDPEEADEGSQAREEAEEKPRKKKRLLEPGPGQVSENHKCPPYKCL